MGLSQTYLLGTLPQDVKMWENAKINVSYCVDNEMDGKGREGKGRDKDRVIHLGIHVSNRNPSPGSRISRGFEMNGR